MLNHFRLYFDLADTFADLTDEEAGKVIKALLSFCNGGEVEDLTGGAKIVFGILRRQFERDAEAYDDKCKRLSVNGSRGGRPKKQMVSEETNEKQMVFSETKQNLEKAKDKDENKNKDKNKDEDKDKKKNAERFARFWTAYPRKEAKQTAIKAFERIKPDDATLDAMLSNIARSKESAQWQEDGGRFIPHPATWLNQRRWEDEPPKPQEATAYKKPRKDDYEQRPNEENDMNAVPEWLKDYRETHAS